MIEKIKKKKDIFSKSINQPILTIILSDQNIDDYYGENFEDNKENCKFIEDIYNICCLYPINNLFKNDDQNIIDKIKNTVDECIRITYQYRFSGALSPRNKKPIAIKFNKQFKNINQLELRNILYKFKSLYEYNNLIEKYNDIFDNLIKDDLYDKRIKKIIKNISRLIEEFNNVLAKDEIIDEGIVFQIDFNKDNKGKIITNIINYVSMLISKNDNFKPTTISGGTKPDTKKPPLYFDYYEIYDIKIYDIINVIIYTIYKDINIYLYFDYYFLQQKIIKEKNFPNEIKKKIFDLVIDVLNEEYGFSDEDTIFDEERSYEQVKNIYKNYYSNEKVQELFKQYIIFLLDLIVLKLKTKKPHTTYGIKRRRRTVRKKTVRPRTEPTPYTKYGSKRRIKTVRPRTKPSPHTPDRTKRRKISSRSILHTKYNNTRKRKRSDTIPRAISIPRARSISRGRAISRPRASSISRRRARTR